MKRLAFALALLSLAAAPALAEDKEFNRKGTFEIGGGLGFESGDGATSVRVQPQVGWFLASSFELLFGARIEYEKNTLASPTGSSTNWAGLAGAGYFIPLAGVYVGPQALLGFGHVGGPDKNQFTADGGLSLKVPFGNAALIFVNAGYRYAKIFDVGSRSTIVGDVGFSLWF